MEIKRMAEENGKEGQPSDIRGTIEGEQENILIIIFYKGRERDKRSRWMIVEKGYS